MHIRLEHVVAVGYLASFKELMAWLLEAFKSGGTRSSVVSLNDKFKSRVFRSNF
jgi:hypothetical protein